MSSKKEEALREKKLQDKYSAKKMNEFFSLKLFKYHNHYKDNSVDESYSISEIIEMHDSKVKDYVFDVVQTEAMPHVPQ